MLKFRRILIVCVALSAFSACAVAEDGEDPPRHLDARGEFIRLIRHVKAGRRYYGLLVKIQGSREHLQLLIPLKTNADGEQVQDKPKIADARLLRRNQEILVTYYVHDNRIWVHAFSPGQN